MASQSCNFPDAKSLNSSLEIGYSVVIMKNCLWTYNHALSARTHIICHFCNSNNARCFILLAANYWQRTFLLCSSIISILLAPNVCCASHWSGVCVLLPVINEKFAKMSFFISLWFVNTTSRGVNLHWIVRGRLVQGSGGSPPAGSRGGALVEGLKQFYIFTVKF